MIELIIVLVLLGIVAVFIVPKMGAALGLRDGAWHDAVLSSMRYAQKSAVAHRRLVCASITSTSVTLTIAPANPATSCTADLLGPDGTSTFATSGNPSAGTAVSPAGTVYFQPDGRVTSTGDGATSSTRTISMSGANSITVNGETGYVQ